MTEDRRGRRLQTKFEAQDRQSRLNGLRQLLSTADGRRFVWLFLGDCRVFTQPFSANALQTSFNCGELNVGQKLLAEITEADPDAFLVLIKENQNVDTARRADAATLAQSIGGDTGSDE